MKFHLHCWHNVEGSERKVPVPARCKLKNPEFIREAADEGRTRTGGGSVKYKYVLVEVTQKCCLCPKTRVVKYRELDVEKALGFTAKV
jgi:hypothetical protein